VFKIIEVPCTQGRALYWACNFILAYDVTCDNIAVFLALKAQLEVPEAIQMCVKSVSHQISNARLARLQKFNFNHYMQFFGSFFNDLKMYGKNVASNKKVTGILVGNTCPDLQTIKTIIHLNANLIGNFILFPTI
jgi:hypothetical protein